MKLKTVSLAMLVFLSLVLGRAGSAQEIQPLEPEWLRQMHAKRWQKVQEGVLQRDTGKGRFETFGYGAEGLQWLIQDYQQQVQLFEDKYKESPNSDLLDLIEQLRSKVDSLNAELQGAPSAESFDGEVLAACSITLEDPLAYAGPQPSTQGVMATASARFNNDCGYVGRTTAYAYAHAIDGTVETTVTQIDPKEGASIESYAYAEAKGSTGCESRAEATVEVPQLGIFQTAPPAENYSCPDSVSVTGPAMVTTDYYGATCADVTWTANVASGRTDYAFDWYIDTDPPVQGTGSTFTKTYCNTSQSVTVKVVARDTAGTSYTSPPFTTIIKHIPAVLVSFSGPTSVTTDNYINSGCADVTWTAAATGGHPPHTYTWYFDTDAPVQGNPFTKRICATNKSVTLKVVATDSDGHTDDEIKTIVIQHIPAVVASISGPTSVTADFYVNSGCVDATWTASATGGHPGYTYSWYVGTDPTVQGTGSTFTKSYCKTSQSVTVTVVARDSDGHSDDATRTTSISYKGAIVATISGPTSVSSSTSCTTVTWTVSVNGNGHTGLTYKWFIGTTQQTSTSTTFSKQFCSSGGTSQSVTVKATATASDGHSDTDTHTTSISFPPPPSPTASISGPTSVQLTSSTECKSITWTASATGGTPGYTYSWYIGTSTTVQGTATTLTKTFCGPQTINVKVVVRDSAAQTDDATFTTKMVVAALTASISGQDYVEIYGTQCADLTWTANVSGGTPAYTYSWTIGTSTTVLSTTSTLTKRVCTSQTLNVKVTVRDSSSTVQTANATFTTTVTKDTTCFALCQ